MPPFGYHRRPRVVGLDLDPVGDRAIAPVVVVAAVVAETEEGTGRTTGSGTEIGTAGGEADLALVAAPRAVVAETTTGYLLLHIGVYSPSSCNCCQIRYAGMTGAQIERERAKSRRSKKNSLTDREHDEFEEILSTLSVSRKDILNGMGFALDFADMATEVVQIARSVVKSCIISCVCCP